MEEKTSMMATVATTSIAEETATTAIPEQAECELPTVSNLQEPAFSLPLSSLDSLNKLTSFIGELYTYSYLINKATGATDPALFIASRVCDDLAEAITADEFLTVMKEFLTTKDVEYVKGIELKKEKKEKKDETDGDKLVFTCFQNLTDLDNTGMKQAATSLFNLMSASIMNVADKKRRINLHKVGIKQPDNENLLSGHG